MWDRGGWVAWYCCSMTDGVRDSKVGRAIELAPGDLAAVVAEVLETFQGAAHAKAI